MKKWPQKIASFLKETQTEVKRVTWPDRKYATSATVIIIMLCLIIGFVLSVLDFSFAKLMTYLTKVF